MTYNPVNKKEKEQDRQQTQGNNYEQKGSIGIGHMSGGEIEKGAMVAGVIYIYNYYDHQEPVESDEATTDDNLPCPYRGLEHFRPNDAEYFFGRKDFIEKLFKATQTHNFISVLGASGSGKSSVVLAGLIPKLEQEQKGHWKFTHFRPSNGNDPFYALAEALVPLYRSELDSTDEMTQADKLAKSLKEGELSLAKVLSKIQQKYPNHKVLLIADQFEELYTQYSDLKFRHRFLDCLLASFQSSNSGSSSSTILVTTMRTDFLANALSYRPFADMPDIKLGAMSREELTEVIEKPAEDLGVTFEAGLVEGILDDVENEPGNLPLLEFALKELWKKRTGKRLTHNAYEAIGKVKGALADYADNKYGNLTPNEQEQARRIFIQLVRPGEETKETKDTRRQANRTELGEENWDLVTRKNGLADSRLVVTGRNGTGQETVEVVHEALIQNWGKLQEWMKADRKFRTWQDQLRVARDKWEETKRDKGALLRGKSLVDAEYWLKQQPEALSVDERNFIQQSQAWQKREKRIWISISATMFILVVSAFWQWKQVKTAEINAQLKELSDYSVLLFDEDKQLDALVEGVKAAKQLQKKLKSPFSFLTPVDANTQMEVLIRLEQILNDITEKNSLEEHKYSVNSISFSPDGKMLASASGDGRMGLWRSDGSKIQLEGIVSNLPEEEDKCDDECLTSVSFSHDGKTLALGGDHGEIFLFRRSIDSSGKFRFLKNWSAHESTVNSITFSSDGKRLASGSEDGTIKLWTLQGEFIGTLTHSAQNPDNSQPSEKAPVNQVIFSPDGQLLASASQDRDGTVKFWQIGNNGACTSPGEIRGFHNYINSLSFSPDCRYLVLAKLDGTIVFWSFHESRWEKRKEWKGHESTVNKVSFSPDGKIFATASNDTSIKLWDSKIIESPDFENIPLKTLKGHNDKVLDVTFSPKSSENQILLASASKGNKIKLWQLDSEKTRVYKGQSGKSEYEDWEFYPISFSPDGQNLAIVIEENFPETDGDSRTESPSQYIVQLHNLRNDKVILINTRHSERINDISFSPKGKFLATASLDDTVKLWNLNDGTLVKTFLDFSKPVVDISFSPDETLLVTASFDNTVKLWNLDDYTLVKTFRHEDEVNSVSFSPDGQFLASASKDNTIRLWSRNGISWKKQTFDAKDQHTDSVTSVIFSPDGKLMASSSRDATVKLWKLNGSLLKTLKGHSAPVNSISFSADGKTIASASNDKTVRFWNLDGNVQKTVRSSRLSTGKILKVRFTPEGGSKRIVFARWDGAIKLWDLELNQVLESGCNWLKDYLETNPPNITESDRHLCDN